jgi:alpha-D-ribose 1-methylphosphonate 5-triphosphate diphosphatase
MAVLAHDAQIIGAGITTAFDCLALSGVKSGVDRAAAYGPLLHGLTAAAEMGALRADHLVHLRCELTDETVPGRVAALEGEGRVRMLSVMDHTPGDRQFADPALWLERHRLSSGLPDDELLRLRERRLAARTEVGARRAAVAAVARRRMLPLASHDDASAGQVEEAHSLGASITEFPTTMEAADAARARGIAILMGAPNMVRGRSHVGNLSAADCAQAGLLDVLASDYVPAALLPAAFLLTTPSFGYALPRAVATVTINPARAAKLLDRGRIAAGLRADLVRVRPTPALPVVREVWREGCRVH